MEFSGLSVIKFRNLVSSAVGNGFLCTLCVLKNPGPRHGRKRNKALALRAFGRPTDSTESREKRLGLRNGRQFLFLTQT